MVSYNLDSRGGDRAAFADMVSRCKAAGVNIIVDSILNHMTGYDLGAGKVTYLMEQVKNLVS